MCVLNIESKGGGGRLDGICSERSNRLVQGALKLYRQRRRQQTDSAEASILGRYCDLWRQFISLTTSPRNERLVFPMCFPARRNRPARQFTSA